MTDSEPASRPAVWMVSGAACFAAMGAFTHALAPRVDWLTIALVRATFMFVMAVTVARASGTPLVFLRPRTLWMRSLSGSFSLVCSFFALTRLPLGDVLTITHTYPLWILILTWLALRETPRPAELIGVACGVAGVALIGRPHLGGDRLGAGVALASSFSTAVAMIGLHRLRGIDARAIVAHFAGVASLVAATWMLVRIVQAPAGEMAAALTAVDRVTVLLLAAVGVTGTAGQIFLTRAYAAGAPARVAVLGLTQVVFGLGIDVLVWHRSLPASSLAGTLLVLAPAAWLLKRKAVVARQPRGVAATPSADPA